MEREYDGDELTAADYLIQNEYIILSGFSFPLSFRVWVSVLPMSDRSLCDKQDLGAGD